MRQSLFLGACALSAVLFAGPGCKSSTSPSVLQHRKNPSRDGQYVDPLLTHAAVAGMHVDPNFHATTSGQTFAQPLFLENGPGGKDTLFVATEDDDVFALDALSGAQLWKTALGTPAPRAEFCGGSIDPLGITGTPVIDAGARKLYVAGMLNVGTTPHQMVWGLSVDTGQVAWSVDVSARLPGFDSTLQNQRGALALVNGTVYVPYGGLDGDCGNYRGWVVAVPTQSPQSVKGWATAAASGSGIWAPSGIASDGTSLFVATGNTNTGVTPWDAGMGDAIIKLSPGPSFSAAAPDYFAPSGPNRQDWLADDTGDLDLGSSGVVLIDVPGAAPGHLAFGVGKTQYTYLVNRDNLGGIGLGLTPSFRTTGQVFSSLLAYNTASGTYVGGNFLVSGQSCSGRDFTVLKVGRTSPPVPSFGWCGVQGGDGALISSTTDGANNAIVWAYGAGGDQKVRAYDGDTGQLLFTSQALPASVHWVAPIVAKGRLYAPADGTVTALTAL